ncbi:MAG TPA: hypothetical protein VGC79_26230 [Polyangiaceae bacterium]
MLTRRVGSMLAIRQNRNEATAKDWADLQADLSKHQAELDHTKILVYTDGGTLTAPQRKELMAVLGDSHALVAAVSDSMKVRFAGSTISLFQKNYKQFTTAELSKAYEHLQLTIPERRQVEAVLKELEAKVYPNGIVNR